MNTRILIADDDDVTCRLFAEVLENEGYLVDSAHTCEEALERLSQAEYQAVILDVRMPGMTGLEAARIAHERNAQLPIIVMTAFGDIDTAVEAIRDGAFDFISKPMNLDELKSTVARALRQPKIARERADASSGKTSPRLGTLIGASPAIVDVYKTIARAAPTASTVLITGESGTGKELVARAIHTASARRFHPFVAIHCGALTDTLLESELFGHEKGAFTGAQYRKKGKFEIAEGGTVFLDEIGDISVKTQTDLLRVLQEHEITRVGGHQPIKVDFRCVAATNRSLEEMMADGRFRADLFYRLNVFRMELPPLRERPDDIPLLVDHFVHKYASQMNKKIRGLTPMAMLRLQQHAWPGNVRELENAIERAIVVAHDAELHEEDFGLKPVAPLTKSILDSPKTLDEMEKQHILRVLEECHFNQTRAAEMLHIDRVTLHNKLKKYGWSRAVATAAP